MKKIISFVIFLSIALSTTGISQERELREMQALGDTLFKKMSIEELKQIQKTLQKRVSKIEQEEQNIRDQGLGISESFVEKEGENIKEQDKILIRVAEYYIEEADDNYIAAMDNWQTNLLDEYDEKLRLYDQGLIETEPEMPETPEVNYDKAIEVYEEILEKYPYSEYADDALFNKAFLLEQMQQGTQARRLYQEVIDKYPESHFAAQSYMQIAEYYFNPRDDKDEEKSIAELYKALRLYKNILKYRDSKLYDQALYKIGWTYYKLAVRETEYYSDALLYFLAVANDIENAQEIDPNEKITDKRFMEESIEYIGIIFAEEEYDHNGVDNARRFLERIGEKSFSVDIMRELGEYYQKIGKDVEAIYAFENLLEMYPDYPRAPFIKKNIADAYYDLGQDDEMYRTRMELFENYNPETDWYAALENSDIPDKLTYQQAAMEESRKALYNNVATDLIKAQEREADGLDSLAQWEKVAENSQKYIDAFGKDSSAYEVNWVYAQVLDRELNRLQDAFEEYMKVSNDYLREEHQQDAANNAVSVASSMMKSSAADTGIAEFDLEAEDITNPDALSEEEKNYIEALDNYIRLFPNDELTPEFLAAAGAVYFNHKQFAEAKVYFNTLVKRFPGAKQKNIAMRSIMNSYFALGKFQDSEFIAKRILASEDLSEEDKVFAEQRLAQAIFKNAKLYEDQGQYLEAALEYRRVFEEAPEEQQLSDVALYNSGKMFEEIQEWEKAIESYSMLIDNYPESKNLMNALVNTAADYKELKQFSDAGATYERIYDMNKDDPEIARNNLLFASSNYEKGEDWNSAIRVNNLFISTFPDDDLGNELYFANAGHYLKLNNIEQANLIYAEFAQRYPNDPKAVQAFYERGSYFKENMRFSEAKAEFNKAIAKSEEFNRRGLDPNRYYVGETLNELVDMLHDEFVSIELKQPESNIQAQRERLRQLLLQIVDSNKKIIANASIRSFEATYKSAEIFEEFANIYANQERKANLTQEQLIAENNRINSESAKLYEAAVDEYKNAYKNIPIIAERFGFDIFAPDTAEQVTVEDSLNDMGEVVVDTSKQVARKWYDRSASKISSLLYKQAELTKENVNQLLGAPIPESFTTPLQIFTYKQQILTNAVAPAINATIQAHQRNIQEADELGLQNKYVEESKRQIILTNNILAQEIEKLTNQLLDLYPAGTEEMENLAEQGDTENIIQAYMTVNNNNLNYIEVSRELGNAAINNYSNTLAFADNAGIQNDLVRATENRLFRFAYELSETYKTYKDTAETKRIFYENKFNDTENYNYYDLNAFYIEYEFAFGDFEREILENAFAVKQQYQTKNDWTQKILYRLLKIDPIAYGESVDKERAEFTTDDSWYYSDTYQTGFTSLDFDITNWKQVDVVPIAMNQYSTLGVNPDAIWIRMQSETPSADDSLMTDSLAAFEQDSLPADSGFVAADTFATEPDTSMYTESGLLDSAALAQADTIYFRKKIQLNGTPVDGTFYLTADDDYKFWINEEYMIDDADEDFDYANIDTLTYSDISFGIKQGENVFSFEVIDFDESSGGVKLYGYIEYLPVLQAADMEKGAEIRRVDADPETLKRINTLNKNKIFIKQ